jgi:hypothetical protein
VRLARRQQGKKRRGQFHNQEKRAMKEKRKKKKKRDEREAREVREGEVREEEFPNFAPN